MGGEAPQHGFARRAELHEHLPPIRGDTPPATISWLPPPPRNAIRCTVHVDPRGGGRKMTAPHTTLDRRTFLKTTGSALALGLAASTSARAQPLELKIGYMPHPIHENS